MRRENVEKELLDLDKKFMKEFGLGQDVDKINGIYSCFHTISRRVGTDSLLSFWAEK